MDRRSFLSKALPASRADQPRAAVGGSLEFDRSKRSLLSTSLAEYVPNANQPWDTKRIQHLYRRAGFGATMAEISAAKSLTPSALVDKLLRDSLTTGSSLPAPPPHSEEWLGKLPYYGVDQNQSVKQQQLYYYAVTSIRNTWAAEMTKPDVMLREKMVYFWANHFVTESQKVYYPQMEYDFLNLFRKNPWGNFKQLVKDVTVLPAMLLYLDGGISYRTRPNENYGRELMELFTLGVNDKNGNPNYTETDIHEVAKALTGYTIKYDAPEPNVLASYYNVNNHDASLKEPFKDSGGPRKAYGLGSAGVADDIIDALFQYKGDALAWFIASKLYAFFVYDDISGPTERAVIDELALLFKNSNWELKPVIAKLLKSEHFYEEANIGAKIKSPYEYIVSMFRGYGIQLNWLQAGSVLSYAYEGGQYLLDPPNVKGWPGYRTWISTTTLPARNAHLATPLAITGRLAASGATGFGETNEPIVWSNDDVTAWAKQFANYRGEFVDFLAEVAQFVLPQLPSSQVLAAQVTSRLSSTTTYEWPGLPDADKIAPTRTILNALMLLAEYQLQ